MATSLPLWQSMIRYRGTAGRGSAGRAVAGLGPAQTSRQAVRIHRYLITVKGNQPKLDQQLRSLPGKTSRSDTPQIARAHGRIEEAKAQNRYRRRRNPVPVRRSAIQVVRRTRRRGTKKTWQNETVYAITSLPAEQAQPRDLAHWIRSH
jgi:hypothetical protein